MINPLRNARLLLAVFQGFLITCALSGSESLGNALECSALFRQLTAEIHRPGLEWSRSLPETGTPFRWAQVKGYVYLAVKALRPPKPADPKARQNAMRTIDGFFNEVIKGYPEPTQNFLKRIYYENANQVYTNRYFLSSGNLANWHYGKNAIDGFSVEFDESQRDAELLRKLFLVHECAVHIGQMDQRLRQIGPQNLAAEHADSDSYLFTEMSAALAEKTALSVLDFSVVEAETGRISDPIVRVATLGSLYAMSRLSPRQYVELLHRRESLAPTPAQVEEFLREPPSPSASGE